MKENGDVLNSVIEQLQGMERDAKTENALGVALVQCSSYRELAYSIYIELAWVYENLKQPEQEVKCYARAYYLWQHEGFNDPFGRYKDMLIYAYKNLVQTDLDYENWSQEQLKQAEADLKEKWGEVRRDENGL